MILSAEKQRTDIKIVAGPKVISEAERAIQIDPSHGIEHGVILLEEKESNENLGTDNQISYHLRAKVLSLEGASLGNIVIPYNVTVGMGDIHEWWGRTIFPDGTVIELDRKDLKEQVVAEVKGERTVTHTKAVLRGIVPGCVIDFGYVYFGVSGFALERRVALGRMWPVKELRYRWVPFGERTSSYRVVNTQGLSVTVTRDNRSVLVIGKDLPVFRPEPYGPPLEEIQPAALFYYLERGLVREDFWKDEAKRVETRALRFFEDDTEEIKAAIEAMKLPADASLETKLKGAYDWVLANIKNLSHRTSEELEAAAKLEKEKKKKSGDELEFASDLLKQRRGYGLNINYLYMGIARALGAEAHVIKAPDRTDHYWDPGRLDVDQFQSTYIAVGTPGAPLQKATVVTPGTGLPYGEIPWWTTGTRAMISTLDGAQMAIIPALPAHKSLAEARADIRFEGNNDSVAVSWSRQARGQTWYSDRSKMISMTPNDRKKRLEGICGSSSSIEVTKAEVLDLDKLRGPFEIRCEIVPEIDLPDEEAATYEFSFMGPWIEPIPELNEPTRVFPVIFSFPHTDITKVDVTAPSGFVSGDPPSPVKLETPFGSYLLGVSRTETGFHVERSFVLTPLRVEIAQYADLRKFLIGAKQADSTARLAFRRIEKKEP